MSYFERFIQWQNYVHYILNAILIWVEYEYWMMNIVFTNIFSALLLLAVLIFINDTVIHAIFWFLPEDYGQWRD